MRHTGTETERPGSADADLTVSLIASASLFADANGCPANTSAHAGR